MADARECVYAHHFLPLVCCDRVERLSSCNASLQGSVNIPSDRYLCLHTLAKNTSRRPSSSIACLQTRLMSPSSAASPWITVTFGQLSLSPILLQVIKRSTYLYIRILLLNGFLQVRKVLFSIIEQVKVPSPFMGVK